eukprot:evm.model.scf_567.3 EVM.evm.TU.scf_567.3   scf_567:58789-75972(+)
MVHSNGTCQLKAATSGQGQFVDCNELLEANTPTPQVVVTNESLKAANDDLRLLMSCVQGGTLVLDLPEVTPPDTLVIDSPIVIRPAAGRRKKVRLRCPPTEGRVLEISSGGVEISGIVIRGCKSNKIVKVECSAGEAATISRSTFAGNEATASEGVVDVMGPCSVNMSKVVFTNNKGGGLGLIGGASASLKNCTFDGNIKGGSGGGGAICAKGSASLLDVECTVFNGNEVQETGGAIELSNGASAVVRHCTFSKNMATGNGGAVAALDNSAASRLDVTNTTFRSNKAEDGGALFLQGVSLSTSLKGGSRFLNNSGKRHGGAISGNSNGDVIADGILFSGNEAGNTGGAVQLLGAFVEHVVRFTNSIFEENKSLSGGALHAEGPMSRIELDTDVQFNRNTAMAGGAELGGGAVAFSDVGKILIRGVSFRSNLAIQLPGGAVVVEAASNPSEVTFVDSTFFGNAVQGQRRIANGGGLHLEGKELATTITGCIFEFNAVDNNGGGIAVNEIDKLKLDSVVVFDNSAGSRGGGMIAEAVTQGGNIVMLTNVTFASNAAGQEDLGAMLGEESCSRLLSKSGTGGGLALEGEEVSCTITGSSEFRANTAAYGGAVSFARGRNLTLEDVSFVKNSAVTGGAVQIAIVEGTEAIKGSRLNFTRNTGCLGAAMHIACQDPGVVGVEGNHTDPPTIAFFEDVSFDANKIKVEGIGGGGMAAEHIGVSCKNCSFVKNECSSRAALGGGALVLPGAALSAVESRFERNEAGEGGGVYCEGYFLGRNSSFSGNKALKDGGALRGVVQQQVAESGKGLTALRLMDLHDCMVTENRAKRGGGAFVAPQDTGIGLEEEDADVRLAAISDAVMAVHNSRFQANNADTSGGALFAHASEVFEINCGGGAAGGHSFRNLTTFDPELCGWANNTVSDTGYGAVVATVPVSAQIVPNRIVGHSSGELLKTVVVTIVDGLNQTVNSRETLVEVGVAELQAAFVFGQEASHTEGGRATFDGTFLKAQPGTYQLEYSYVGIEAPMVLEVEVRPCAMGEVERGQGSICEPCQTNLYSFNPKDSECKTCPTANAFCNGSTITPLKGYWHSTSRSPQIAECLHVEPCDYKMRKEKLAILAAEAHASNKTLMGDEYPLCASGYKGVLCGACADDFGRQSSGACAQCGSRHESVLIIALASLWSTALIAFFVRSVLIDSQRYDLLLRKKTAGNKLERDNSGDGFGGPPVEAIPENDVPKEGAGDGDVEEGTLANAPKANKTIQILEIIDTGSPRKAEEGGAAGSRAAGEGPGGPDAGPDGAGGDNKGTRKRRSRRRVDAASMSAKYRQTLAGIDANYIRENRAPEIFKIAINFLQQISIALAINVEWTTAIKKMLATLDFAGGFSNASAFFSMDCALLPGSVPKSIRRTLLNLSFPFLLMVAWICFWFFIAKVSPASRRVLKKRIIVTIWGVLYVTYFDITSRLVRTAYCVEVDDPSISGPPDSVAFDSYWSEDTGVKCWQGQHLALFLGFALPLFLLIPVGLPTWLVSFLWVNRTRFDDLVFLGKYGELYKAYRKQHVYWEAVIMLRKALLSVVVVWRTPLGGELQGLLAVSILVVSCFAHLIFKPYSEALYGLNQYETLALGVSLQVYLSGLIVNSPGTSDVARVIVSVLAVLAVTVLLGGFLYELAHESHNYLDFLLDEKALLEKAGEDAGMTRKVGMLGKYYVDKSKDIVGQSVAKVSSTAQRTLNRMSAQVQELGSTSKTRRSAGASLSGLPHGPRPTMSMNASGSKQENQKHVLGSQSAQPSGPTRRMPEL